MTAPAYATRADVYKYGTSRGSISNQGRVAETLGASMFQLSEHGFAAGDPVTVRSLDGTDPSGTTATITFSSGTVTLTGVEEIMPQMVSALITISGAATPANNGTFAIATTPGLGTLTYANASGATDVNNGHITWSISSLPAPLVEGTTYYALPVTDDTFQLSTVPSGSAITLTTSSSTTVVTADLPWDDVLQFYSRFVDAFLPAHAVPLTSPYPITVVALVAELAAKKLQLLAGISSDSMRETELSAKAQLERWAAGIPLRDDTATPPTNTAVNMSYDHRRDPRGWGSDRIP